MSKLNKNKNVTKWQYILYSKIFMAVSCLVLFFLSTVIIRDYLNNKEINSEIQNLDTQIKNLDFRNQNLSQVIKYLKSDSYVENEAKNKFGLSQKGESVIVISDEELNKVINKVEQPSVNSQTEQVLSDKVAVYKIPNYKLWWMYFFK